MGTPWGTIYGCTLGYRIWVPPGVPTTYRIEIKPPTYAAAVASGTNMVEQPVNKSLASFNVQTKIRLWHQRFPHPSAARLYEAIHGGHILGTGIPKDTPFQQYEEAIAGCKSCALGKARLSPHHAKKLPDNKSSTLPHQHLHFDIKTINKRSWGNNYYVGLLVDDFTREKTALPLRYKSEAAAALTAFNKEVTRPRQYTTKTIKVDRGGEQRGADFKDYLSKCRIQPQYTSPGDSAANGVAERSIEVVEGGANTMRIHGGLPAASWAELYSTTCFLESYLPTSANPGKKSPHEMRFQAPKDVSFLRTIGTECTVYTLPKHRRAQEDRGVNGKLVGYSTNSRCYRVKLPNSARIVESAFVKFYEKVPQQGEPFVTEFENNSAVGQGQVTQEEEDSDEMVASPITQPILRNNPSPSPPSEPPDNNSQAASGDHIRVPSDLAEYLDPDLVAEGEVVPAAHSVSKSPAVVASGQSKRSTRSRGHVGDSLQQLS